MNDHALLVPEDPTNPGSDVLRGELGRRTHYIHNAMAEADGPLTVAEIGRRAEELARLEGFVFNEKTFAPTTTRVHLFTMRDKRGFAEQLSDGRWQLTEQARQLIKNPPLSTPQVSGYTSPGVRTVDEKGRLLLPREFANATVTIERVSENEIRIQKAVVIPQSAVPLLEDHLTPLSDRDRDLFLGLLDHPPEPTPALRAAATKHKKRHG